MRQDGRRPRKCEGRKDRGEGGLKRKQNIIRRKRGAISTFIYYKYIILSLSADVLHPFLGESQIVCEIIAVMFSLRLKFSLLTASMHAGHGELLLGVVFP